MRSVYSRRVIDAAKLPDDPEASGRVLFALSLAAGALLRLVLLGQPDLSGPDEGVWALGARNLVEGGIPQFFGLSAEPLGDPSGVPVFFPVVLSLMVRVFGPVEWAIRLPSVVAGLVGAFVLERLVRRGYGQPAGHFAGAFAALLPPLVSSSRAATVETTLVALGLGGVIFGIRAFEEDRTAEAALSGYLFGCGFLAKGDAVFLFLGPLLAALLFRPRLFGLGKVVRSLVLLLGTFVLTGGSHLLLTALFRPEAVGRQLAIAFGDPGSGLEAAHGTAFGADLKTLVGALFLFLPLAGLGAAYLLRPLGENEVASGATDGPRRLDHGVLWGVYGVELLVLVAASGKLSLSSIPVLPAIAAFAGFGAAALVTPAGDGRRKAETTWTVVAGLVVLAAAGFFASLPDQPLFGGRRAPLVSGSALSGIAATAAFGALLAAGVGARRFGRRLSTGFIAALLVAAGIESAGFIRRELLTHRTFAREIADQISPAVAKRTPRELAFRSPETPALSFLLFRTGRAWNGDGTAATVAADLREGTVAFWAFRDGMPQGPEAPDAAARALLESRTREVTADVTARAGRPVGVRVFVAEPLTPAAAAPGP